MSPRAAAALVAAAVVAVAVALALADLRTGSEGRAGAAASAGAAAGPGARSSAGAAGPPGLATPVRPAPRDRRPPPGWRLTAQEALRVAAAHPAWRSEQDRHPESYARVALRGTRHWQVSLRVPARARATPASGRAVARRPEEVARVIVADGTGQVVEAWTGIQVEWVMARGYPGAFGGPANDPAWWGLACGLFLLPFLRPPLRLLHLDLAALLAFTVSYAYFNAAAIDVSVPLAYPPLLYLLARSLWVAVRRSRGPGGGGGEGGTPSEPELELAVPARVLFAGLVALVVIRVAAHAASANVIDVGYAGVIGADRLLSGLPLYGSFPLDNLHGDTYGPVLYLAYVPFALLAPWSGTWDDLPAAHLAAVAFDLLAIAALWLLGRRLRGPRLGLLLAWAWVTYPFTFVAVNSSANDALVAALVAGTLLVATSPPKRGALVALAGLTKFAPLLLAPALATYRGGGRPGAFAEPGVDRGTAQTVVGAGLVAAVAFAPVLGPGSLDVVWERTLGFQADRASPFSVWGLYDHDGARRVAQAAAAALAVGVAFRPRRRDVVVLAALGAAALIALELALAHWFFTYLLWFLPLLLVALLAPYGEPGAGRSTWTIASARPGEEARTTTALSHGSTSEAS